MTPQQAQSTEGTRVNSAAAPHGAAQDLEPASATTRCEAHTGT